MESGINLKQEEGTMLGVELLANPNNSKADLTVSIIIGWLFKWRRRFMIKVKKI